MHLGPAYQICLQPTMLFIEAKYERWPRAPGWSKARAPPLPPAAAAAATAAATAPAPAPAPDPAPAPAGCPGSCLRCHDARLPALRFKARLSKRSSASPTSNPALCVCVQGLALRLWFRSSCVVAITFLAILMPWFGTIIGLSGALSELGGWVGLPAVPPLPAFLPPARLARPR